MERLEDAVVDVVVEPRLRGEMLRDELSRAIQDGRLAPGERLDEVRIARRFGVSRTPVREALRQLAAVHLVEIRPHKGAVVAGIGGTALASLAEAAVEVGVVCARLAATRRMPGDVVRLRERHEAWRRSLDLEDREAWRRAAAELETAVAAVAANETLAQIAAGLRHRLVRPDSSRPAAEAVGAALVAAIERGDAAAAEDATRRWFEASLEPQPLIEA